MTDADRDRLRKLQDRWLASPIVKYQIGQFGWEQEITGRPGDPTFASVRDVLHPQWEHFFLEFIEEPR